MQRLWVQTPVPGFFTWVLGTCGKPLADEAICLSVLRSQSLTSSVPRDIMLSAVVSGNRDVENSRVAEFLWQGAEVESM